MRLLRITEVAERLAVSPQTVHRIIDQGKLSVVQITDSTKSRRVLPSAIDEFIKANNKCQLGKQTVNGLLKSGTEVSTLGLDELLTRKKKRSKQKQKSASALKIVKPIKLG